MSKSAFGGLPDSSGPIATGVPDSAAAGIRPQTRGIEVGVVSANDDRRTMRVMPKVRDTLCEIGLVSKITAVGPEDNSLRGGFDEGPIAGAARRH